MKNQYAYVILPQCFSNLFLIVRHKEDSMISPDHLFHASLSTELEKENVLPWNTGYSLRADCHFLLQHCLTTVSPLSFFLLDYFTCGIIFFQTKIICRGSNWTKILLNGNCSRKWRLGDKKAEQESRKKIDQDKMYTGK